MGVVVWTGVDYAAILDRVEGEADVIVWDGGNNDFPFFTLTLHLCLVDPHRADHESRFHPGETNLRLADVVVVMKEDSADPAQVDAVKAAARALNLRPRLVDTRLPIRVDDPEPLRGRRVLAVDDGPTLTHGGLPAGAAELAARRFGAILVDPRPYAKGSIQRVFQEYPMLGPVLPAVGYDPQQMADLRATIDAVPCDVVLLGTPIDLGRVLALRQPVVRVHYEIEEVGPPGFDEILGNL
jgi:predicted GTPase